MPSGDSHEGVSLLGEEKRVVPFLAEGEAKATELGASLPAMVLMNKQWGPLQILHSRPSGVVRLGGGGLQLSGLVGFAGKRAQGKNKS